MWWNAIGPVAILMVPGALAAVALTGAVRRTDKSAPDRPQRPVGPWAGGR